MEDKSQGNTKLTLLSLLIRTHGKSDTATVENEGNRLLAFDWNFLGLLPCSRRLI
jgi:hypothetical protein